MNNSNEDELVIFGTLNRSSLLNIIQNYPAQTIEQIEFNSRTDKMVRITTRARRTLFPDSHIPEFKSAIKIRLPRNPKSSVSRSMELESIVNEEQYLELLPYAETHHRKNRYTIDLGKYKVEVDIYIRYMDSTSDSFVKLDIEGATDRDFQTILDELKKIGIQFIKVLNPPGVSGKEIGDTITAYMANFWNFKNLQRK